MIQPDGTNAALAAGSTIQLDQPPEFVQHRGEGRSPRQQRIDKLWSWYTTDQYAARSVAWDGTKHVGEFERDSIALAGFVPPGFHIAGSQTIPILFRRPTTPYHLTRVAVDRFTSLLFSQKRHPRVTVEGDADTDALLGAIIETGRLWPTLMQARAFGGSTGTAPVGFKLINGRPRFEVFDPRWCTPLWLDRTELVLYAMEYRYPFTQEVKIKGEWHEVELWYRRVIDTNTDIVYEPEMIEKNDDGSSREPAWKEAQRVPHGFGFCPVAWIQNLPNATDIDGDPDCVGGYELIESIDRLIAQVDKALLCNLDPTLVMITDALVADVKKGSDNALKLPVGGDAKYLEINAAGIAAANEEIASRREMWLEVVQVVLEQQGGGQKTATEIERTYSSMLAKADVLREQYGEFGVKRLLNMAIVAVARVTQPKQTDSAIVRGKLSLPKRAIVNEETGERTYSEHKLGPGPYHLSLQWPNYFEPSIEDTSQAANAAVTAKGGGLIDGETAARFVANAFGVEDVKQMVAKIKSEQVGDQAELEQQALRGPRAVARTIASEDAK